MDPDPHPFRGGRTEKPAQAADARKKGAAGNFERQVDPSKRLSGRHGGTAPAGRDRKRGIRPDRSEPLEIHRHGRSGSGTGARVRHDRRIGRRQRHGRRQGHSGHVHERRRPLGLRLRRLGQGPAPGARAPARHSHNHHRRHRQRGGPVGRRLQHRGTGEDRLRRL